MLVRKSAAELWHQKRGMRGRHGRRNRRLMRCGRESRPLRRDPRVPGRVPSNSGTIRMSRSTFHPGREKPSLSQLLCPPHRCLVTTANLLCRSALAHDGVVVSKENANACHDLCGSFPGLPADNEFQDGSIIPLAQSHVGVAHALQQAEGGRSSAPPIARFRYPCGLSTEPAAKTIRR